MNKDREKFSPATLRRLLAYMREYRGTLAVVVVCIILSAIASAASSLFLQTLIDDYIAPLLKEADPVYTGLVKILCIMAVIYLVGACPAGYTTSSWSPSPRAR
jgi:ATP-binding cassette subfamily B multidrug efflux pump